MWKALSAAALALCWMAGAAAAADRSRARPNFIVIVADDLGFTDLGAFGGEIRTPNLDALATRGVRLVNFHTPPICAPTRAQLMTGVDHHLTGLGTFAELRQPNQMGRPGYEGGLNDRVVTVAEVLRGAGYRTLMTGKWHLGFEPHYDPSARGFDRAFALIGGGANHFGTDAATEGLQGALYRENGQRAPLPADFYSSDFFTSKLLQFLAEPRAEGQPFFAYLAFTAPHYPLQARAQDMARYRGTYDAGWEALRRQRLMAARQLGIVEKAMTPHALLPSDGRWAALPEAEKRAEAKRMEIFAAMVDRMDQNIGRLTRFLRERGELDNTVILFLSDNGPEGNQLHRSENFAAYGEALLKHADNSYDSMGTAASYLDTGPDWAQASSAPFRLFKAFPTEGGTRVVAFVNDPRHPAGGRIERTYASVLDLPPTLLEWAGIKTPPARFEGRAVVPFSGRSLAARLAGGTAPVHAATDVEGWESFGRRAIRQGRWKVIHIPKTSGPWAGSGEWELFDVESDPGETTDLAKAHPDVLGRMVALWDAYARKNGVVLPEKPNF